MKTLPLLGGLLAILAAGCTTDKNATGYHDHWTAASIGPSMARHGLNYDRTRDGDSYLVHQWRQKQDINLTLSRHFLNQNPDNPFQPAPKNWPPRRDPHSILPDPWNYLHLESLAMGGLIYGWAGVFIPLPIDSIIASFDKGGPDEFWEGINRTTYPLGVTITSIVHEGILPFPKEPGDHARPRYPSMRRQPDLASSRRTLDHGEGLGTIYTGPMGR